MYASTHQLPLGRPHSSRVAAWALRYFEKAELNVMRSDGVTVGTLAHCKTEEEVNNVEYPDGESATSVRENETLE